MRQAAHAAGKAFAVLTAFAASWSCAAAEPAAPAATLAAVPAPSEPEPRALDLGREIVRLGFPEEMRAGMFGGAVDAMTGQMRDAMLARFNNDPAARAIMDRSLDSFIVAGKEVMLRHIPAFMNAYATGYARAFPVAELEQILAFVKTPAGAHFLQRSPTILADPAFAAANQDYIRDLQPLIEQMRTKVTRELVDHFRDHPPKPSTGS